MADYTIASAVSEAERMMRRTGRGPTETVQSIWGRISLKLSAGQLDELAMIGLAEKLTDALHDNRRMTPLVERAVQVGIVPASARPQDDFFISVTYSVADGSKPLNEFTQDDCYFVATQQRQQAMGLMRVADFMTDLATALKNNQAATVQNLPRAIRVQFANKWPMQVREVAV